MVAADGFRVYFKQAEMSPDYVWRWLLTSVSPVKKHSLWVDGTGCGTGSQ